jgi:hypothetical protein
MYWAFPNPTQLLCKHHIEAFRVAFLPDVNYRGDSEFSWKSEFDEVVRIFLEAT